MEIPVWSEMKSGVKIAVALAIVTLIISFSISVKVWYNGKINQAVTQAYSTMQLDYAKRYIKLQDRSDEQEVKLKAEIDKIRKDNDEKLKVASSKYNALSSWVNSLPKQPSSSTGSSGQVSSNPGDSEDGSKDVIGVIRRQDAGDLAKYASDAEEIRLGLLACYAQYDSVKTTLDKFKEENKPASLK